MRIPRSSTYAQFFKRIYQKIGVDSNEYLLKVSAKHSCQYLGRIKETLFPITNNDALSFLLDPEAEIPMLELYVDAEKIHVEPPPQMSQQWGEINLQMSQQWGEANPQMSNQWGEYMTLLATPGLPSCSNTDYLAGTSNPDFGAGTSNPDFGAGTYNSELEYYTTNMATVTQGLDNIDFHYTEPTQSHTPLSENFIPHENDAEDPTGDSFVNESDEASEPDEAEYPIPPEDGPDHVDINVMAATFAQRGVETSSKPALPDRTTQPTLYHSILFFEQTFPEIPADSVDVPNLRYAKFYNKSEGRLDKGMLFKTKEELMEAVQDHSIRHARREYYVTKSSKTKWKVLCKHSTEEQWCRWELRGHVKCNPSYGIKHVIQNVKDQTGYDVPYQKAWYSLKMARKIVYGTWESSVRKLPKYLGAIKKYNPGTIIEWKHKDFQQSTGKYVMGYVFWAFKPCIDGFQFCRKIISVDGTNLYTKYKYKLLIAAAMDGNQQSRSTVRIGRFIRRQNGHGMNTMLSKLPTENAHAAVESIGIPCSHAKKVCGAYNIGAASMVKDYYDLMAYNNTYSKHFEPVQSERLLGDPNFQLVHDPTIRTVTRPGRNQTTHIHNEMD
ncbi:UNVERIFIED_CONTAM: hypothetical protein Scaly_0106200 [Sesamum calycinum]|uniref:Transposase MuDR plant domain-containing protein n=1 Tax=Sesamum calycinum TaxID=2727403 RepID=A0AAW2SVT3_9LAMI